MNDPYQQLDVPTEKAIYVVDMRKYSQIPESRMEPVRMILDDVLATAFAESGMTADRVELDTGDGAIFIIAPAQMWRLIDPMTARLDRALRQLTHDHLDERFPLAVRTSVHVGPLTEQRLRGEAINYACRLVNSGTAYTTMDAAIESGARVGLTLSDLAFRRTVLAGRRIALTHADFAEDRAQVTGKEGFDEPAWAHVPGLPGSALRALAGLAAPESAGSTTSGSDSPSSLPNGVHFHGNVGAVNGSVTELNQTNHF